MQSYQCWDNYRECRPTPTDPHRILCLLSIAKFSNLHRTFIYIAFSLKIKIPFKVQAVLYRSAPTAALLKKQRHFSISILELPDAEPQQSSATPLPALPPTSAPSLPLLLHYPIPTSTAPAP